MLKDSIVTRPAVRLELVITSNPLIRSLMLYQLSHCALHLHSLIRMQAIKETLGYDTIKILNRVNLSQTKPLLATRVILVVI